MKTAVMTGIGKMELVQRAIPEIKSDEVLVKLEYVGICGSDMHYFEKGRIGDYVVEPPFVLGHEAAGEVIQTGSEVTHLKKGDKVALEPGKTCGRCKFCLSGRYNLCADVVFFATPPVDGVFQEYAAHEANLCFKLPKGVGTLEGALIEPLAVGFHAAVQGEAKAGGKAAIFGAGCIGLMSMMALKSIGLEEVYMIDVMQNRLDNAVKLGAKAVVNSKSRNAADEIIRLTENNGCDLIIETSGSEIAAGQAIRAARKGAVVVFVGYSGSGMMNLPMNLALDKEITFKTVFRYRNVYPKAIKAVTEGKIPLKEIVSDIYSLDDIQEAMDSSIRNKSDIIKSVIKIY